MKITLDELRHLSIDEIIIESHAMDIYVVFVRTAGLSYVLCGQNQQPCHFRSISLARKYLEELRAGHISLRQHSPYGEMIGLPEQTCAPLKLQLG